MEFLPVTAAPPSPPKNLYPCLAVITVGPTERSLVRRLSAGSFGSNDGEENALKRVISGGRRKSSFGAATGDKSTPEERRTSIFSRGGGGGESGSAVGGGTSEKGTWYWRVQAGVNDNQLVLLPLSQPPNPVLTHPPAPLSQAMPTHSASKDTGLGAGSGVPSKPTEGEGEHEHEGLLDKMKNLLRRGSTTTPDRRASAATESTTATTGTGTTAATGATADTAATATASSPTSAGAPTSGATEGTGTANIDGEADKVIDQTARGEQLPSPGANAIGATNINANAELGWPGTINGEKLGAIVVSINSIVKDKIHLGGGKRNEDCWVTVPITSHFAGMVQGMGTTSEVPKSGTLKLEFDKDWIGAKAESELLHFHITNALSADRSPMPTKFHLGGAHPQQHPNPGMAEVEASRGGPRVPFLGSASTSHPNPGMNEALQARRASQGQMVPPAGAAQDVAPDESVGSGRKVPGEV